MARKGARQETRGELRRLPQVNGGQGPDWTLPLSRSGDGGAGVRRSLKYRTTGSHRGRRASSGPTWRPRMLLWWASSAFWQSVCYWRKPLRQPRCGRPGWTLGAFDRLVEMGGIEPPSSGFFPERTTSLVGSWLSCPPPLPTAASGTSRLVLSQPYRCQASSTPTLSRPLPAHRG